MKLIVDNILDLMALYPEDKVNDLLQAFSCTKNKEVEGFAHEKAIDFAKKDWQLLILFMQKMVICWGFSRWQVRCFRSVQEISAQKF